jgi:hypothetical protein
MGIVEMLRVATSPRVTAPLGLIAGGWFVLRLALFGTPSDAEILICGGLAIIGLNGLNGTRP